MENTSLVTLAFPYSISIMASFSLSNQSLQLSFLIDIVDSEWLVLFHIIRCISCIWQNDENINVLLLHVPAGVR